MTYERILPTSKRLVWLLCLGVAHLFVSTSFASSLCEERFVSPPAVETMSPEAVLTRIYDENQWVGIAVPDHSNFQAFTRLMQLIEARGLDPRLKTIVVEDTFLRAEIYAKLSVEPMTKEEFERDMTSVYSNLHPQDVFLYENVLPLVRKINASRGADPLLVVPVDGVTQPTALETAFGISTPARNHSTRTSGGIEPSSVSTVYGGSILRERETAGHFRQLVADKYPARKSIIIYQAAHIMKNLSAVGVDTDGRGKVVKRAFLGWIEIARQQVPSLKKSYGVIAIDNKSSWAPNGVLNYPPGVTRSSYATGYKWNATSTTARPLFASGTFMKTYRNATITSVDPKAPIFDGVIVEP